MPAFSGCAQTLSVGSIVINEVVSSNSLSLTDPVIGSPDWVELYNPGDHDIDLSGFHLTDNIRNIKKFTFDKLVLPAHGTCIVYLTDSNGDETLNVPCTGFGLSRSGEYLYLVDSYYGVVQELKVPQLSSDVAFARRSNGSYGYTLATTANAPNIDETILDSLPDLLNHSANALCLSEIVPYPETGDAWVEVYNASDSPVRLEDYYLSDNPAVATRFCLPAGTLGAGEYALVSLCGKAYKDGSISANFRIGREETAVYLSDAFGTVFDTLSWETGLYGNLAVIKENDGIRYTAFPTPGAANSTHAFDGTAPLAMDKTDPLRISEVLNNNRYTNVDLDGDPIEWVELFNSSEAAIELSGYFLSDDPDSPFKWRLPERKLDAGCYCLVFLSGKDRADEYEIHAPFGLRASETALLLTDADSFRIDTLPLPADCPEDVSIGRSDDGAAIIYYAFPTPGYANATAFRALSAITERRPAVLINEVFACGTRGDDTLDWVELHNVTNSPIDLSGWFLSDSVCEPQKWRIGALTLPADGYTVIHASPDAALRTESIAGFGISAAGELLLLSESDGTPSDRFLTGALSPGISCGRPIDGARHVFYERPTPGAPNDTSYASGYAPQPLFSETELYHDEAFYLTLSSSDPRAEIRYTLNGAEPNRRSPLYQDALCIDRNTVVRAAAYIDGYLSSETVTRNFLFETPHTVPVFCLSGDPDEIKTVQRTRLEHYGNKPEAEVNVSFYETDGTLGASFPAGIRAKGHSTLMYSHKAFTVHLRGSYDQTTVTYPFFPDSDIIHYSAFSLRGGGQDRGQARLRDSFFSRVADGAGLCLDNFRTRVVVVYINGAYYGVFDLNEQQDASYLAGHYGVDPDSVDIIRRNDEVLDGTAEDFLRVREYARTQDFSDDAVLAAFSDWVDIDYFTDYIAFQSYFANDDMLNQKYWHSADNSIKWRPILFDIDFGLHRDYWQKNVLASYFTPRGVPSANKTLTNMDISCALRQNDGWCNRFIEQYVKLAYTQFAPERLIPLVDEMAKTYRVEMPRHFEEMKTPGSMRFFESSLIELKTNIERRRPLALAYLSEEFGLSQAQLDALIKKYQ